MMKKMCLWFLLCSAVSFLIVPAICASEIFLDDGSVIRAEVVSLQNGVYILHSPTLGEFKLDAHRIKQIGSGGGQASVSTMATQEYSENPEQFKAKLAATQAEVMNDPEAMKTVTVLASDPKFQRLMQDPQAVAAIQSGDTATLLRNPLFQEILNDPRLQGIAQDMVNKKKARQ